MKSTVQGVSKVHRPKNRGIESLRRRYGRMFVFHWELGLVLFFFVPIIYSLHYSVSEMRIVPGNVETTFVGLRHYRDILFADANYLDNLLQSVGKIFTSLPVILALSLIFAVLLNQPFKGRILARAVFFLPVIIASGVVMNVLTSDTVRMALFTTGSAEQQVYGNMIDFEGILNQLRFPKSLNALFSEYLGDVFNLVWSCGVQTVLFIAGLQTIPRQLYEVSKVEGATAWEEFWYITIPMLGQIIQLVTVYTMIELFVSIDSSVMVQAYAAMDNQIYDRSSAMLWLYFALAGAVMGLILLAYRRFCIRRWE